MPALVAVAGCGSLQGEPRSRGNFTLEQAREFDDFPLYFAGDSADGLPLVAVLRRNDTADYVSFVYGDCALVAYDDGCTPPVEIQVWPSSVRDLDSSVSAPSGATVERTTVKGRPAAFLDEGTRLEIDVGRSTVVVFADSHERATAVGEALRCATGRGFGADPGTLGC